MWEMLMWKAVSVVAKRALLPRVKRAAVLAIAPVAVSRVASARNRTLVLAGAALAVTALVASRRAGRSRAAGLVRGALPR